MKRYQVTWGNDSKVVQADNEGDAWSQFVAGNAVACSHPKLHERKIEEVKAVKLAGRIEKVEKPEKKVEKKVENKSTKGV